jgi:CRP-like cAMP-binding protein
VVTVGTAAAWELEGLLKSTKGFCMQRFMLADVNEEQIMDKRPRSVPAYCLPHSPFRIKWDGLLLVLLTFTCISSPLRISMIDLLVEENVELARALDVIELIVDLLFVVDFILSFSFAYFDDLDGAKAIVRDPAVVFHHNRRSNTTYFCALALVPFFVDVITGSTISNGQAKGAFKDYVSLFGILRVFRLVLSARVFDSLNQFIASLGMRINAAMFRMIVLLFFFMMGVSITGCLYFFVACHPIDNTCKQTWLGEKSYNSSWAVKDPQVTERWSSQFSRSIYFSMQTLFTIGYGDDVVPVASSEIIVACVLMYLGQFAYACTIANMTSLMGNMDVLKMRFRQEMDALNRYMEDCSTPHGLRLRVKDFFEYLFQKQYGVLDSKITGSLPPHLSMEIVRHHTRLISKVPFFNAVHRSYRFVKAAASKLEARTYTPHSTIMFLREKQRELLIVTSGSADVYSSHSKQSISTLLPGDFIGDYQLIFGTANIVSVKSGLTFVDVLVLSHKCLYETLAQFDDEVVVSKQDPGVRVTIEAHQLRTERFSKLHLSMKKTTKNKKVMDMLENVVVAHDSLVILPSSTFHVYWDVTKLLALLYLCFMIPYRIMLQCDARQSDVQRCTLRDCIGWRPDLFVDYL